MNFKFESLQDNSLIQGSSYFMDFGNQEVMTTEETAILEGKLRAVFGEPWYQSENSENSISYIIKATDADKKSVILEVYNVGMFHIGAPEQDGFAKQAAEALIAYVNAAEPCDYERTIYYLDFFLQMDISVKNGVATVEESEISDEKADALSDK
ncbi:MAG: hypothetical protein IJ489_01020 [Clostridia bacterium]|nr:hypothetical protein [Clostridia bacterium]